MASGSEVQNLPRVPTGRGTDYELLRLVKELEWLRTLAHVSPVAIVRADALGRFTYVNERWSEMTGRAQDTALGESWELGIFPDDIQRVRGEWQQAVAEKRPLRIEYRYVHPIGRIIWILAQVVREVDGRGRTTGYVGTVTDITELHQIREELQRSHAALEVRMRDRTEELQRMARIVEMLDDAVVSADLEGRVLSWNRGAEAIFGYPAAEMIDQPVFSLAPPEKRDEALSFESHIRGGGEIHHFETTAITKTGERLHVVISGYPLRDAAGTITGTWAIMRNVTERKRAEEALRASEAKYRRLHETMRDAFVIVDLKGRILEFNSAYEAMLGYSADELRVLTYMDLTPQKWHAADARITAEQVLALGDSGVHEKEYRRKDGTIVPVEVRSFLIRDDSGQSAAMWAIVRDVTERTRTQQALRQSEERLRLALDNGRYGLWDWDLADPHGYADERWHAIHGYASGECPPTFEAWSDRLHPEDRERVLESLERHLSSDETPYDVDYRFRAGNGDYVWLNSRGHVNERDADGKAQRIIGTTCNIAERKRVEHQLQHLSRRLLCLQDDERRRLARDLHDSTAQTLAALSMNLSVLAREDLPPLPEARRLQLLKDSMELAEQATGELRTTSYLLHPPLLDERGLPAALRWFTEGFAGRSGIKVKLAITPDLERLAPEVETALFRVVQESLHNVHRHSGSESVEISLEIKNGMLTLEIRDRGCGITPEASETPGVGIAGMKERLLQLGGTLLVVPKEPGTAVIAHLRSLL